MAVVRTIVADPIRGGAPLVTPVTRSNRLGIVASPTLGVSSWACTNRPTRRSHSVLADIVCVRLPNVMAGTEMCVRVIASNGVTIVGRSDVDPDLVVKALHQLQARRQTPRELREDLDMLVGPRVRRVGARLTVLVAQVLVAGEEPQAIANRRTADVRREVVVPCAFVAALLTGGSEIGEGRRAGSSGRPSARSTTRRPETARFPAA